MVKSLGFGVKRYPDSATHCLCNPGCNPVCFTFEKFKYSQQLLTVVGNTAGNIDFIGETGTYIVVDSKGHIVNRMENDPTWDPSCCGTCYKTNYGGSGGGLHLPQFNATGNSGRRPVKI